MLCWPVIAEAEGVSPLPLPVRLFPSDIGRVHPGHHQMTGVLPKISFIPAVCMRRRLQQTLLVCQQHSPAVQLSNND